MPQTPLENAMLPAPIHLQIRGLGHCPSFKNSKMLTRGLLITKPEYQKWMKAAIASIESQLRFELATRGIGTTTGRIAPLQIAQLLPLDDSRKWIPDHCVHTQLVSSESEAGADITIERIK
jgi:hypothetical protein